MSVAVNAAPAGVSRWVRTAAVIAAAGLLAWMGFQLAFVNVAAVRRPELALRLAPDNPIALAKNIDDRLLASDRLPPAVAIEVAAVTSLEGQLVNQRAVRLLAFASDLKGDRPRALRLIRLAQRLSRRDLRTRLWLIEHYAAAGDADGALRQYDLALRTSSQAPAALYPVLSKALSDQGLWASFGRYLQASPQWMPFFLTYAIREGEHPEAVAQLLLRYGGPDISGMESTLLGRLVAENRFDLAARYFRSRPSASAATLTTVDFTPANLNTRHVPVTWNIFPSADMDATFVETDARRGRTLAIRANPGAEGTVARKFVMLRPGVYRVTIQSVEPISGDERVGWQVLCPDSAQVIARSGAAGTDTLVRVPGNCPAQFLDLIVVNRGQDNFDRSIGNVTIRPVA